MTRNCTICGKPFPCAPSDNKVTCSKECSRAQKIRSHMGKRNQWSEESRARLRARGQSENLKLGTQAAMRSPLAGPYETNKTAKHWILRAPDGTLHEFDNLALFVRQHPDWFPNPKSARSALSAAAACMAEATTPPSRRGREFSQYKGWQVVWYGAKNR